jgi:hypothetical protein
LRDAFGKAGIWIDDVRRIGGADGRIKAADEYQQLFELVDGFDGQKDQRLELGSRQTPSAAGDLNSALQAEVAANLKYGIYNPGTTRATVQPKKTENDALIVAPRDRKPTVTLNVIGKSQFAWGAENGLDARASNHVCFDAAEFQTNEFLTRTFGKKAPRLADHQHAIQVAFAEDAAGRVELDPLEQSLGHDYVDRMLDKGLPVMVGVSLLKTGINNDKLTDHFVTIFARGYDAKGRAFYDFKDPGLGGRTERFYVDARTDTFFRVALPLGPNQKRSVENFGIRSAITVRSSSRPALSSSARSRSLAGVCRA